MDDFLEDMEEDVKTSSVELEDQEVVKLTERAHILLRPGMYLGSSTLSTSKDYIIEEVFENNEKGVAVSKGDMFVQKDVKYVPGLVKIFNELIDNSIDEYVRTNGEFATRIEVSIDSNTFSTKDNGRGIPVRKVKTPDGEFYQPELAWTHARAGSNFKDDNSSTIGTNGVGSMIASVFSKSFVGISQDGTSKCTVKCFDNNEKIETKVTDSKQKGVQVKIVPDLERFGITEIDSNHIKMIEQRLHNLSVTYPGITFKLNGERIRLSTKKFMTMFGTDGTTIEEDNYIIGVFHSDTDDFKHFSLMNGLTLRAGGAHVDYITNGIVKNLREKIVKKYKTIKPADIKRKLFLVTILKDFKGPQYETQTKEKLTNPTKDIQKHFDGLDLDKFADKVYKNKAVVDSIIDYFKIAEEFKKKQELNKLDKSAKKKPKDEKFIPPVGEWKNIFLCEGDSAQGSISSILGREGNGFYAMFGVPPNAYDMSIENIIKSDKMKSLQNILQLQFGKTEQKNIPFDNIVIATDADLPGFFIRGQLLGMLYRFGRNLFGEGKVKVLTTPLFLATDSKEKIVAWFYNFEDQKKFEKENPKLNYEYKKGLGSWDQEELEHVIKHDGLDKMLETITIDDVAETEKLVHSWLSSKEADTRKEMLNNYYFNIINM
jgi:DNA topoisomerase-2